jgi:hypothetical protein
MRRFIGLGFLLVALGACTSGCPRSSGRVEPSATPFGALAVQRPIAETIYDGTLAPGWKDQGWAPHELGKGPASIDFSKQGGLVLAKPLVVGPVKKTDAGAPLPAAVPFGGLLFRVKAPEGEAEFLEVRLDTGDATLFPRVKLRAEHKADVGDGWAEVYVPMEELNPESLPFDRLVFRAFRSVPSSRTLIDKVAFTQRLGDAAAPSMAPAATVSLRVECGAKPKKIEPWIYGIAWKSDEGGEQWLMGPTARRWGGNPTSRYNWELGNAWNTASDWFFENVEVKGHGEFLAQNEKQGIATALTVPTIGWVAKDTKSSSFSTDAFPSQQATDGWRPTAGNGVGKDGKKLVPGPPTRTSVPAPPEFVARWVDALRKAGEAKNRRTVDIYILDNEPMLWDSTHRDVHPEPVGYDELLDRTIRYGTAVRSADPQGKIAGPALWGWPAYQFSAKDAAAGFRLKPDRRAHGDTPLLVWWLRQLKAYKDKTGTQLVDLVDLHFYPQHEKVYSPADDPKTAAMRIRSTRGLWDTSYVDESWINEPVYLLPRLQQWIAEGWPGLGMMIGEWSFGGEKHMSGGLATAEALGRFGQNGVSAAFYWTVPPAGSPAAHAFAAYRNNDGKGGKFEDWSLPTAVPANAAPLTSLFASRDGAGTHVVTVLLNFSPDAAIAADVELAACGGTKTVEARTYTGRTPGFAAHNASASGSTAHVVLPAYSITVLDVRLAAPIPTPTD